MSASNTEYSQLGPPIYFSLTTAYRVFRGGTFHFDVGPSRTRFTIHQVAVARKSEALTAMMKNGMKESQEGCAPLRNTDEPTFARFVEFIYTGDYNPAQPIIRNAIMERDECDTGEAVVCLDASEQNLGERGDVPPLQSADELPFDVYGLSSSARASKAKKGKKKFSFYEEEEAAVVKPARLPDMVFNVSVHSPLPTTSKFVADGDWSRDYLPLLLSHAQLYVFADTYGIEDLKTLTAARLHVVLSRFDYPPSLATDVAELVEYAFEHTSERSQQDPDMLRKILTQFSANNIEALKSFPSFLALMGKGGPFMQALVFRLCDRFGAV